MRRAGMGTQKSELAGRALLAALAVALAGCTSTPDNRLISLPVPQTSAQAELEPATQREHARILASYGGEHDNAFTQWSRRLSSDSSQRPNVLI